MSRGLGKTQRAVLDAVTSLVERGWSHGSFKLDEPTTFYEATTAKIIQEVLDFTNEDIGRNPVVGKPWQSRYGQGYTEWVDYCFSTEMAIRGGCATRAQVGAVKRALATLVKRQMLTREGAGVYSTPDEWRRWDTPELKAKRAKRWAEVQVMIAAARG